MIPTPLFWSLVLAILMGACRGPSAGPAPEPPESTESPERIGGVRPQASERDVLVASIRELKTGGSGWDGRRVVVRGYYFSSSVPMIVDDPRWPFRNTPLPPESYLLVRPVDGLAWQLEEGDLYELAGQVRVSFEDWPDASPRTPPKAPRVELVVEAEPLPVASLDTIYPFLNPLPKALLSVTLELPADLQLVEERRRLAVLIAGGYDVESSYPRYWNDLVLLYSTLKDAYGIPPADIRVLFKDGVSPDGAIPVDGPALKTVVEQALKDVAATSDADTDVFLYFGNHGGGALLDSNVPGPQKGRVDLDGDETDEGMFEALLGSDMNGNSTFTDQLAYDECIFLYDTVQRVWDDDLSAWLAPIEGRVVTVLQPCFAGGFLGDLAGPNRVVVAACSEFEYSWAKDGGLYDEFTYWFASALRASEPDGTATNADKDGDGRISIAEAFEFAVAKDARPETPWIEDDGDGRGRRTALGPYDGALSRSFYLDGKL